MSLLERMKEYRKQCGVLRQEPQMSGVDLDIIIEALDRAERFANATDAAAMFGERQSVRQHMTLRKFREAMK